MTNRNGHGDVARWILCAALWTRRAAILLAVVILVASTNARRIEATDGTPLLLEAFSISST
jgi:hypothetical protein